MRCSAVSTLMMAALIGEAVADPTHAHLHRRAHQKKRGDGVSSVSSGVNWKGIDYSHVDYSHVDYAQVDWTHVLHPAVPPKAAVAPSTTPAVVAAAPKAAPKPDAPKHDASKHDASKPDASKPAEASSSSAPKENVCVRLGAPIGISNSRSSFGSPSAAEGALGDFYQGNSGVPYGSNMFKVGTTDGFEFTNTFTNSATVSKCVSIWNKAGPDHEPLSGSALAPKITTLTIALEPGESQIVAVQANTQMAWAVVTSELTASGAYATCWGEAQYRVEGSGFDYSCIMSTRGNIPPMTITCAETDCISSETENMWLTATQYTGNRGGSCFVPGKTMHLTTTMG